ncbi:thioredoxin reductase [Halobacteriales archaeon QS_1_68_20]|nr:MAG: thioredoxin reductase [Halobacteriales archaeon QS_1_68_20]
MTDHDVIVVGGGVAGLSAATFTARHDFETTVIDAGDAILRRNAHLENFPGFPAGVNARLLLAMMRDQAERSGCPVVEADVTSVEETDGEFAVETAGGDRYRSRYVVAATKNEVDYLDPVEGVGIVDRGKTFVDCDEHGRTGVDGLYAAGRLAGKPHQAVVSAGHGAEVAVTLLEDDDAPFYHDWVAPEGYFTGRDREVPPGCEEIDDEEFRRREATSLEVLRAYVSDPYPEGPRRHPSLRDAE